jgi:AraC-like DNA-binding protein
MELVCFLSRIYAIRRGKEYSNLLRLSEVVSHLERNYAGPIRTGDLVKIAGVSENHLVRTFQKATGCTPIDYLIRLRISRACDLLRREDIAVTEAAFLTGFNDSNYFSRQFKKTVGMSPTQYRKSGAPVPAANPRT